MALQTIKELTEFITGDPVVKVSIFSATVSIHSLAIVNCSLEVALCIARMHTHTLTHALTHAHTHAHTHTHTHTHAHRPIWIHSMTHFWSKTCCESLSLTRV